MWSWERARSLFCVLSCFMIILVPLIVRYNRMESQPVKINKSPKLKRVVLIALLLMLIFVIAWRILLPSLGVAIAISADIWGIAASSIVLICVATLLFFILTGIGIFILGAIVFAWTLFVIVLFPLLFPVLIPVLLLMLVVGFVAKKQDNS